MSTTPISNAEIKRKKAKQARTSEITGTLGLAALGGTALATRPGQKVLRSGFKRAGKPMPKSLTAKPKEKDLNSSITPLLATSAGIGSLGAFNFASYTKAEANKGKPIKKNWEPQKKPFDSEAKRKNRNKNYESAAVGAQAGGAAGGVAYSVKGLKKLGQAGDAQKAVYGPKTKKQAENIARLSRSAKRQAKGAAISVGVLGAGAAAESGIKRSKKSWESYSKRDTTSAFGIQH